MTPKSFYRITRVNESSRRLFTRENVLSAVWIHLRIDNATTSIITQRTGSSLLHASRLVYFNFVGVAAAVVDLAKQERYTYKRLTQCFFSIGGTQLWRAWVRLYLCADVGVAVAVAVAWLGCS